MKLFRGWFSNKKPLEDMKKDEPSITEESNYYDNQSNNITNSQFVGPHLEIVQSPDYADLPLYDPTQDLIDYKYPTLALLSHYESNSEEVALELEANKNR